MLKYSDYKSLIVKTFEGNTKNESCKWYLGNQEQKTIYLVLPRSDILFSIENKFFCVPDWARRKNQTARKKFVHPWTSEVKILHLKVKIRQNCNKIDDLLLIS